MKSRIKTSTSSLTFRFSFPCWSSAKTGQKKKSAPSSPGEALSFVCGFFRARTTLGCSAHRGTGEFPALRRSTGAPNLRMSVVAWSMTSVYPVSTRTTGAVSVHPVSRMGQTNSANCPPQAVGDALPCGSRSLPPLATLPVPKSGECRPPSPVSWRPSVWLR